MWVEGWIIVDYPSVVVAPSYVRCGRATYSIGPTLSQRSWVARRRQNIGPIGACWLGDDTVINYSSFCVITVSNIFIGTLCLL